MKGAFGLLAAFGGVLLATPALAQAPPAPAITDHQRSILLAIEACEKDGTPDWCAPFRPLIAHLNTPAAAAPSSPKVADAARTVQATFVDKRASDPRADERMMAAGHGSDAAIQALPPKNGADLSLSANTDTKTASVTLNFDLSKVTGDSDYSLALTAQTPFGQGATYQNLATLDGLVKSSSIGLQLTRVISKTDSRATIQNQPYYQTACRALLDQIRATGQVRIDPAYYSSPAGCSGAAVEGLLDKIAIPDDARSAMAAAAAVLDNESRPLLQWMFMPSLNAKIGYEGHDYYDLAALQPARFDPAKVRATTAYRTTFQLGAGGTYVFHGGDMSTTASFNYQHAFKDAGGSGQTKTLCPVTTATVLTCVNGFVGAPVASDKYLVSTDFRYIVSPDILFIPIGFDPTMTYDLVSHVYGFQFPVYLFADSSKALTGGVRYDWTSDKHTSVVGVFVTSAFCILPGYAGCSSKGGSGAGS